MAGRNTGRHGSFLRREVKLPSLCEHHWCRCARAEELANMGRLEDAIAVHDQKVRCRQKREDDDG